MDQPLRFPYDTIIEILDLVPQRDVNYLGCHLPPLWPFLLKRKYKTVLVCHHKVEPQPKIRTIVSRVSFSQPNNYRCCYEVKDETDMRRIVEKDIPIRRLEFGSFDSDLPWFVEFAAGHAAFFSKIPNLVYHGTLDRFRQFASTCPIDNLVSLELPF